MEGGGGGGGRGEGSRVRVRFIRINRLSHESRLSKPVCDPSGLRLHKMAAELPGYTLSLYFFLRCLILLAILSRLMRLVLCGNSSY